jgi:hypothetical protein
MRAGHTIRAAAGGIVAGLLMGLMLAGAPAGAQDSGEYAEVINSDVDRPTVGGSCNNTDITVTASELLPGSDATFTLNSDPVVLGTVTANADGEATIVFDLPAGTTLGTHTIVTTGINSFGDADSDTIELNVTSCAPAPGPGGTGTGGTGLARTGTDVSTPVRGAVLVFAAGAALLLVSRKRQAHSA